MSSLVRLRQTQTPASKQQLTMMDTLTLTLRLTFTPSQWPAGTLGGLYSLFETRSEPNRTDQSNNNSAKDQADGRARLGAFRGEFESEFGFHFGRRRKIVGQ